MFTLRRGPLVVVKPPRHIPLHSSSLVVRVREYTHQSRVATVDIYTYNTYTRYIFISALYERERLLYTYTYRRTLQRNIAKHIALILPYELRRILLDIAVLRVVYQTKKDHPAWFLSACVNHCYLFIHCSLLLGTSSISFVCYFRVKHILQSAIEPSDSRILNLCLCFIIFVCFVSNKFLITRTLFQKNNIDVHVSFFPNFLLLIPYIKKKIYDYFQFYDITAYVIWR